MLTKSRNSLFQQKLQKEQTLEKRFQTITTGLGKRASSLFSEAGIPINSVLVLNTVIKHSHKRSVL